MDCALCGSEASPCLPDRPDFEYGLPQRLTYFRCSSCHLVFASPVPTPEEVQGFYGQYSTHEQARVTIIGKLARWQTMRETQSAIGREKGIRILDYGCGNGGFLKNLHTAGYRNLYGYDFDLNAVMAARQIGINATNIISEADGPYDAITLNHVIEHLANPVEEIKRLAALLAPGGRLVIRTPNNRGLMARLTGDAWRGWETPRHLNIMNKRCLPLIIRRADLEVIRCYNSKAMFFGIFHESFRGRKWARGPRKLLRHMMAFLLWPWPGGEETVAIARKCS